MPTPQDPIVHSIAAQVEHWLKNRQLATHEEEVEFADFLQSVSDQELARQASQCVLTSIARRSFDSVKMQLIWNEVIRRAVE